MLIHEKEAEEGRIVEVAKAMCVAARTAPKAKGLDKIHTAILTGEEKEQLANEMDRIAEDLGFGFFHRDANNLRVAQAVVLIGEENAVRGLNAGCNFCGMGECKSCMESGARCAYTGIDLGIAVGSAVAIATDARVDNRVMFSIGRAALEMRILGEEVCQIMGIPLSASGKSPFFDR